MDNPPHNPRILAFTRSHGAETILVAANLSDEPVDLESIGPATLRLRDVVADTGVAVSAGLLQEDSLLVANFSPAVKASPIISDETKRTNGPAGPPPAANGSA